MNDHGGRVGRPHRGSVGRGLNGFMTVWIVLSSVMMVRGSVSVVMGECGNVQLSGQSFNLDYLSSNGPYNVPSDEYIYSIAVCSSLAAPCNNTWNLNLQACATPNTAAVCQEQQSGANSACCGQFKSLQASIFTNATDSGITLKYVDGDACDVCDPVPRDTELTVVCDPSYTAAPTVWEIVGAAPPSPTYRIKLRHASGCAVGNPSPVSAPDATPVAQPVGPVPEAQPVPVPVPQPEPVAVPQPEPVAVPTSPPVCIPPTCPWNQCAGGIANPCGAPIPCNNLCFGNEQCINNFCGQPAPVAAPVASPDSSAISGPSAAAAGWSVEAILLIVMISLLAVVLVIGAPLLCCILVKVRRVEDSESRPFFHWPIKSSQSRYSDI
eukprot:TRINITY_DN7094_c0_g1_i1.p1 TRINITY_DN7094_c0_g1~~TRINITY_DN7094_c0_g1_i1.p1  ORF type:complete len:381 (+),score=40.91 TRINITY_DN7094_c0_g1_i1:17-1159(+)